MDTNPTSIRNMLLGLEMADQVDVKLLGLGII